MAALREGTSRQQMAALLRLAHVLQYWREWVAADQAFRRGAAPGVKLGEPLILAFAHQHTGPNHVDQGRHAQAVAAFRTAMTLREAHGAPADQLESSRRALRAADQRLARWSS